MIDCEPWSHGCRGGWPSGAYEYIQRNGIPHESCAPYQATDQECADVNICKACAEDGTCDALPEESFRHFGVVKHSVFYGAENLKREILTGGPVACTCSVTKEFSAYAGGIFNDTTGRVRPEHAVEVAGWGVEDGVKYWLIRNR